jgi:hypothetical protein
MARSWTRSHEELLASLQTQLMAIEVSCQSYDAGNQWEAFRIATAVHVLVHDGGKKVRSILTQLGIRGPLRFVSSGHGHFPGNLARELQLVKMRISTERGGEYLPVLGDCATPPRLVQFHTWWDDDKIFRDPDSFFLNRRRLVWSMRDQDGGAHLDNELTDPAYVRLSKKESPIKVGIRTTFEDGTTSETLKPLEGAHFALMRQVAWELQQTLTDDAIARALA